MFRNKENRKTVGAMLLGSLILSFGLYNIHQPLQITEGGVIGGILLINHWTGINASYISFALDLLCYAFAFKFLGLDFIKKSVITSFFVAAFLRMWELQPPLITHLFTNQFIAAIAAGFAIYKNAECRQLRSERNAVQRSLNAVNTQYDDLKEKYDSEIKDREFMFSSNNQNVLELAFYERYIVCTNDEKYYHQYSCKNFTETKSFRVFTKDDAKRLGYKPCPKCFKN